MYAIIEAKGKQFRAEPDSMLRIPRLHAEPGDTVTFDVLLSETDGKIQIGQPALEGASVVAEVVRHGRGEKIVVFKRKRRKGYRKKQGHRQDFTEVRVTEITIGEAKPRKAKKPKKEETAAVEETPIEETPVEIVEAEVAAPKAAKVETPVASADSAEPAPKNRLSGQNAQAAEFMGDAPMCSGCGHLTVRNGTCYRCHNCGSSMGCS